MMRVLIAGCGFVGVILARQLLHLGHHVYALKRDISTLPTGVQAVQADLTNVATLRNMPDDIDCLVYMPTPANRSRAAYEAVFIDGWKNLWGALTPPPRRSLLVSSTAVFGQSDGSLVNEETPALPTAFNGAVLLEMEQLAAGCADQCVIVRCSGIYGPGRDRLIMQAATADLEVQQSPPCFTNRIHRDDVAGILLHLLLMDEPEALYLASDSLPAPRYEVLAWLAQQQGCAAPKGVVIDNASCGKRVDNQKLRNSGYRMQYPDYRAGYAQIGWHPAA